MLKNFFSIVAMVFVLGVVLWLWSKTAIIPASEKLPSISTSVLSVVEEERVSEETTQLPDQPVAMSAVVTPTVVYDVPFTAQAPFGEWDDPMFQNGCEEASLVMAAYWIDGTLLTKEKAKQEIMALSKFEKQWFGHFIDTSVEDTQKLFEKYYGYTTATIQYDIALNDILDVLGEGALVIVPADGRALHNPYFIQPGPTTHMLLIIGYDAETKEFIANDPGTKNGKGYRYGENILYGAIRDYPTGNHLPITEIAKNMLIIRGK